MIKFFLTILIGIVTVTGIYNYVPLKFFEIGQTPRLSSSVVTIQGSDTLSASRTTINNNFANLNSDKWENGSTGTTFTLGSLTLSAGSVGVLTAGNIIATSTATSTFVGGISSAGLASSKGITIASGFGALNSLSTASSSLANGLAISTGCFQLPSGNCLLALDLTAQNIWTGASTTFSGAVSLQGLRIYNNVVNFPAAQGASSTVLKNNGSGTFINSGLDWDLLGQGTLDGLAAATTTIPARKELMVILDIAGLSGAGSNPSINFNGDDKPIGSGNAGFRLYEGGVLFAGSNQGSVNLLSGATSTPVFLTIFISNDSAAKTKKVSWTGVNTGAGALAPMDIRGAGVWNNTSAQITAITIRRNNSDSAITFSTGSTFYVYGSKE